MRIAQRRLREGEPVGSRRTADSSMYHNIITDIHHLAFFGLGQGAEDQSVSKPPVAADSYIGILRG